MSDQRELFGFAHDGEARVARKAGARSVPAPAVTRQRAEPLGSQAARARLQAYASVAGGIPDMRGKVYIAVLNSGPLGLTCDEYEMLSGATHQSAAPRFTELHGLGLIVETGARRLTRQGRKAAAYRAIIGGAP